MSVIRMLKVSLVGATADSDEILEAVQAAGLVHLVPIRPEEEAKNIHAGTEDAVDIHDHMERVRHALLNVAVAPARLQDNSLNLEGVVQVVDKLVSQRDALKDELATVEGQIAALVPWGTFNPEDVDLIRESGIGTTFAVFTRDEWKGFSGKKNIPYAESQEDEKNVWVVLFGADPNELPVTPVRLPKQSLARARERREEILRELGDANRQMGRYAHFAPMLESHMESLSEQVDLLKAKDGALDEGPIFAVQGYVPAEKQLDLQAVLEPFTVALQIEDPQPEDEVPVELKNNWFFKGFEGIVKSFSGIRYGEKDFTWTVGILFILFGSLCLLDAGYGLLLAITGGILYATGNKGMGAVFGLTGIFSVIIGLVSGQLFGLIVGQHIYKEALPPLTLASTPLDSFIFSLVVGIVIMAFSYMVAIWQRGIKTDATGSLSLVLGAAVLVFAKMGSGPVLKVMNGWQEASAAQLAQVEQVGSLLGYVLLGLALLFWVIWPDPVFGKSAHAGNVVWTVYAGSTGFVQDVLSHMRLFGIALSGSILAMVVNEIGGQLPLPATILFAVVGHIFVFLLALLSLYIHTNRLIFLEFGSKNIDGGHNYYTPLKRGLST